MHAAEMSIAVCLAVCLEEGESVCVCVRGGGVKGGGRRCDGHNDCNRIERKKKKES